MKKKKGFNLKKICGADVVIADGIENINFNKMIGLNDSAAIIWNNLQTKDFTKEDMLKILLENYADISVEQAKIDVDELCKEWLDLNIIEA